MSKALSHDVQAQLDRSGLYIGTDGKVEWRKDAPDHPKNWSVRRKILDTGFITLFVTISCVSISTNLLARVADKK